MTAVRFPVAAGPQGPAGPQGVPGPPGQLDPSILDAKGDLIVATANDTPIRKAIGADNTVLTADAAQTDSMKWVKVGDPMVLVGSNLAKLAGVTGTPDGTRFLRDDGTWGTPWSLMDAKGDLIVATANDTPARKVVGADNTVLTADAAQADSLKWVKVGDPMVLAGSNLAKLATVTGTPDGTKFLRDDGTWAVPNTLPNNNPLRAYNAAGSTLYNLAQVNSGDNMVIGNTSLPMFLQGSAITLQSTSTIAIPDAVNIVLASTTGTRIGTAATQKLSFYSVATPIVQPSGTGETTGFTAGTGTAVNDASTFTGNVGTRAYRISDIVKALKSLGLIASS